MELYKKLLQKTIVNHVKEISPDDKKLRIIINRMLCKRLRQYFSKEYVIEIYHNIDYEYYDIPAIFITGIKVYGQYYIPESGNFLDDLQKELNNDYQEYVKWFKDNGWDVIVSFNIAYTMKNVIKYYRDSLLTRYNESSAILINKIWDIADSTNGPDIPVNSVELPIQFNYHCPLDEWPPLRIGNGIIKSLDTGLFQYLNGDIVSENMTNLFEMCKREIYK